MQVGQTAWARRLLQGWTALHCRRHCQWAKIQLITQLLQM